MLFYGSPEVINPLPNPTSARWTLCRVKTHPLMGLFDIKALYLLSKNHTIIKHWCNYSNDRTFQLQRSIA